MVWADLSYGSIMGLSELWYCCGGHLSYGSLVEVMKMGNIAHKVGIEPISLAFKTSVLTITEASGCYHQTHTLLA